jgi:hypothetical protein
VIKLGQTPINKTKLETVSKLNDRRSTSGRPTLRFS